MVSLRGLQGSLARYFSAVTWVAMLSAMLLKDSNPTGVTDSTPVLVDCKPAIRMVGSKAPRTSISLPKISAIELRYSAWVNRRMLAT